MKSHVPKSSISLAVSLSGPSAEFDTHLIYTPVLTFAIKIDFHVDFVRWSLDETDRRFPDFGYSEKRLPGGRPASKSGQTYGTAGHSDRALARGPPNPERCYPARALPQTGGADRRVHPGVRLRKPDSRWAGRRAHRWRRAPPGGPDARHARGSSDCAEAPVCGSTPRLGHRR